jgi:membrane complex biogenesis BtpA family protein
LAIACAAGARFIRVNVLCCARVTDQGLIQGIAHDLLRDRRGLCADGVAIYADVDVKHSAPLAARPLADEVHDLVDRGGADALIVSGRATGQAADLEQLREVRSAAGETPVLLGSGVTAQSAARWLTLADGLIVGSSLKVDGKTSNPVDPSRVRELSESVAGGQK